MHYHKGLGQKAGLSEMQISDLDPCRQKGFSSRYLSFIIIGQCIHLHPLAVIIAILAGEKLAGVAGIFLAIPVVAIFTVSYRHWLEHRGSEGLADLLEPTPALEIKDGPADFPSAPQTVESDVQRRVVQEPPPDDTGPRSREETDDAYLQHTDR